MPEVVFDFESDLDLDRGSGFRLVVIAKSSSAHHLLHAPSSEASEAVVSLVVLLDNCPDRGLVEEEPIGVAVD